MNYSETYFELDSEEATHCYHCHLICIKGHVKRVNTKDQSNVIVYGMFVDTVDIKIKVCKCIESYVCWDCQYWCLWLLHNTLYRVLWGVKTLHKVASDPCQEERLFVFVEAALLTFLDLSTTRVIAGKMHSHSPILKTKGVLSNLVILTYLWEQSCILHTLTKLPA